MGAVAGCTKKLCLEKNIKEINLDIQENDIENLNTINSNKNERARQVLNGIENGNNINNNIEEENNEDEDEKDDEENGDEISEETNKYKKDIEKIILIQKAFRKHNSHAIHDQMLNHLEKRSSTKNDFMKEQKENPKKLERFHTIYGLSTEIDNSLKKNVRKYRFPQDNPENNKNGKSKKEEDEEEIISVEQTYFPAMNKFSSKLLNNFNFKAMELIKSPILQNTIDSQENPKSNLMKISNQNQNYLRILSDFGEKRRSLFNNERGQKNNKLPFLSSNKDKKDKKEFKPKKNHDEIKGNFNLKNEKVVKYQGGFMKKSKKKNGFSIVTWSDQSTLHGIYESGMINGICRFYNNKYKSTFTGEYINNVPKGFGVYKVKKLSLQGYWDSSNLNGIAIEVWEDGTYYQGEYENNKKDGIGLYRWPDGTIYQGEFSEGQMTGKGIILYSDDCVFSGEMLNGYMNGYGIFSWGNGSLYMGFYSQDIKHGFGIYIWDSKMFICYIGFWEMGKQQGIGAKINGNKIKYCIWNKGKIATTLKGLYEIDRYLVGDQRGYYHFFTAGYIAKLRSSNIYNFNPK